MQKKVAIVGLGFVGKYHKILFPEAITYDKEQEESKERNKFREQINECDVAFVCVPTNLNEEEGLLDISIVEEVVAWLECPLIIIRSTIPPGTTDYLKKKYKKRIVFQPEYLGETVAHPLNNLSIREWLVLGGDKKDIDEAIKIYQQVYNSSIKTYITDAKTAELTKLMENAFIGTKVTFINEMYDVAKKLGVDWHELRELFLSDPRVSRYYTFVFEDNRGFGGKCLPKDITCLATTGGSEFLRFLLEYNERKFRKTNLGSGF